MNIKIKNKIKEWFIKDIKEQIEWSEACEEVSNKRIQEIAKEKTDDLIEKCFINIYGENN